MKRLLEISIVILVLVVGIANGITPLGRPIPTLEPGESALGAEFINGEVDLPGSAESEATLSLVRFDFGVADNLEMIARLGISEFETNTGLGSDAGVAGGIGLKGKVADWFGVPWGVAGQWTIGTATLDTHTHYYGWWTETHIDEQLVANEFQIALGADVSLENFNLYGGPMLQYIEYSTTWGGHGDGDTGWEFGGFFGAAYNITDALSLFGELQATGDSNGASFGVLWRF